MKTTILRNSLKILLNNPSALLTRKNYIFVLSHMRCYTSLLSHILGSNSEIAGYAEMHQSYRRGFELLYLKYIVYLANNNCLDGRYVLDKILHNYCEISEDVLVKSNVHAVLLLRKPEQTIKSIINLGTKVEEHKWFKDPIAVSEYYQSRLRQLKTYGELLGKKALYFDGERLLSDTDKILQKLTEKLQLQEQLNKEYLTFKYTGAPNFGDVTDNILQGKISTKTSKYNNISIPMELLEKAEVAYEECRSYLLNTCDSI